MENTVDKLVKLAKALIKDGSDAFKTMAEVSKWDSLGEWIENFKVLRRMCIQIVSAVEIATIEVKAEIGNVESKEKLDAVVKILDDALDLPFWVEPFDGPIIRLMVNFVVAGLNDTWGKKWAFVVLEDFINRGVNI